MNKKLIQAMLKYGKKIEKKRRKAIIIISILLLVIIVGVIIYMYFTYQLYSHAILDVVKIVTLEEENVMEEEIEETGNTEENDEDTSTEDTKGDYFNSGFILGDITGNSYEEELLRLIRELAIDIDTFMWLPYAKSAVESGRRIDNKNDLYTTFSSIYKDRTDKVSGGHADSTGLLQIQASKLEKYARQLRNRKERFESAVVKAKGDLTQSGNTDFTSLVNDTIYLPTQLGMGFYYLEELRGDIEKDCIQYLTGYESLTKEQKELCIIFTYMSVWNNGEGGPAMAYRNSTGLSQFVVDFAIMLSTDDGYERLKNTPNIRELWGNIGDTPKNIIHDVIKIVYANDINKQEICLAEITGANDHPEVVSGGKCISRTYLYATGGILNGLISFENVVKKTGGTILGSLVSGKEISSPNENPTWGNTENGKVLHGFMKETDFGYNKFNGDTWGSSVFLNAAATIIDAMIKKGHDYSANSYATIDGFPRIRYDCSGFTSAVLLYAGYSDIGIHTSYTFKSTDFNAKYGWEKITDRNKLQAGDILVMNENNNHVQIYAGDGKIYNVGSSGFYNKYNAERDPYTTTGSYSVPNGARFKRVFSFAWRPNSPK